MKVSEALRVELQSTILASAAYDNRRAILQLEFRSGAVYRYLQVPEGIYQDLLQAASHGAYFNHAIRDRFPYLLVQPAP